MFSAFYAATVVLAYVVMLTRSAEDLTAESGGPKSLPAFVSVEILGMGHPDAIFRVKLEGPGVAVDKEISQETAAAIMQVTLGGGTPNGSSAGETRFDRREPRLSLREFLDSVTARSNPEKMTCFAAYLRDWGGQSDFSRDDIKACFKQAGEALPRNPPRDFQKAISNGWIAEDRKNPGRYYLTRKGEEAIGRS